MKKTRSRKSRDTVPLSSFYPKNLHEQSSTGQAEYVMAQKDYLEYNGWIFNVSYMNLIYCTLKQGNGTNWIKRSQNMKLLSIFP